MKKNILLKGLLVGVMVSVGVLADMTVDKSNGVLSITSDKSGTVTAKVIGPNDEVVVNETYEGNSFTWAPSGADGAYRYDVRVVPTSQKNISSANIESTRAMQTFLEEAVSTESDYAGGSVEVRNGQISTSEEE